MIDKYGIVKKYRHWRANTKSTRNNELYTNTTQKYRRIYMYINLREYKYGVGGII